MLHGIIIITLLVKLCTIYYWKKNQFKLLALTSVKNKI